MADPVVDPVVIVGGGPAGLMLAHELALASVPAVVLERLPATSDHCPGQGLNTTAVELLEQRGLLAGLEEHRNQSETKGTHFAMLWLDDSVLEGRNRRGTLVGQQYLERHLERCAVARGADVRRGHELVGYRQAEDGVTVDIRDPGGVDYQLRAAYLVGADGERSLVRELAGIAFPGSGEPCYGLVADLETDMAQLPEIHRRPRFSPAGGMYSAVVTEPGIVRVITAEFGIDLPPENQEPTVEELRERVIGLNGEDFPHIPARWMRRYGGLTRNAERYQDGRVFLLGDAAHTFFPLAGLRLGTCLQDAVNIGWKIAATLAGWAPPGLLETYHAERQPAGARAGSATDAQLALIHPARKVEPLRALVEELLQYSDVNRHLLDLSTGLSTSYAPEGGHHLGGRRLPHVPLKVAGATIGVWELLATGRGLLLDFADGQLAETARGWAGRVDAVTTAPAEGIDAVGVLVRPDGHVAWAGAAAEELTAALTEWFGTPPERP